MHIQTLHNVFKIQALVFKHMLLPLHQLIFAIQYIVSKIASFQFVLGNM